MKQKEAIILKMMASFRFAELAQFARAHLNPSEA